jgi:virginiamycin B lyase
MAISSKKFLLAVVALMTTVTSAFIAFGAGALLPRDSAHAAQSVSATDVYTSGSDPWGTAFDRNGLVWVALPGCDPSPQCSNSTPSGKIGVFNPTYNSWVRTYTLPANYAQPLFLAFDQQGRLWFPMPMSNALGMFDPTSGTFQQWTVPTAASGPWAVAIDSKGRVWFTEHYSYKIGYFDPSTQTFTEISTPSTSSLPYGITVDAANNVWFTENNSAVALIGEYTAQGNLREYKIRNGSTSGLTPHLITVDPKGNIWWSEGWVGMIGELQVAAAVAGTNTGVTEYAYKQPCNNCGSHTSGISADGYGNIWFDDSLQSIFGSFPDSGGGTFSLYNTPTSNSHPHDGLHVDAQNRIWFDEEFANKLAVATQSGAGNPSPTVGVSPSPSMTATATNTPTVTATATNTPTATPTPGGTIGQDTFQRTSQSLWGKASDGHTWAGDANSASVFSISGNTGRVASGGTSYSAVLGPSVSNGEVLFSGSISSFNNTNFGAVVRWIDGNDWYKAYIDGTNLVIQKKVNGNAIVLKTVAFSAQTGTVYSLRFNVTGTTLSAKVWIASGVEPSGWLATTTDSSLQSGYCGLRMLTQNGAVVTISSFQATGA